MIKGCVSPKIQHKVPSVCHRLFDTAQAAEWYDEQAVARAIAASSVPRAEFVIVTKLHPRDHGAARAAFRLEESAALLRVLE